MRNPERKRFASELARLTGKTRTRAIAEALSERLRCLRRRRPGHCRADELDEIAKRCAALPVLDKRARGDTLGYDECGIPR